MLTKCLLEREHQPWVGPEYSFARSSSVAVSAEKAWIPSELAKVGNKLSIYKRNKWLGGFTVNELYETTTDWDSGASWFMDAMVYSIAEVVQDDLGGLPELANGMDLRLLLPNGWQRVPVVGLYILSVLRFVPLFLKTFVLGLSVSFKSTLFQTKKTIETIKLIKD